MDNNFKLRKAIIIAIALMGTGYSMHSKAVGLGDILVKSNLGQPLLANIKVNGINNKMDEGCFSVNANDANAISDVKFKLNRLANNEGVLTITSNSAVVEPIASLTIANNCETTFTRQYNLLIDPADLSNNTTTPEDFSNSYAATTSVKAINVSRDNNSSAVGQNARSRTKSGIKTKPATAQTHSVKASTVSNDVKTSTRTSVAESTPKVTQAKLTISAGNPFNNPLEPSFLKLNFDKTINTNRESNPEAYAEVAAFSDELTVMNNRLAHLDKQLNSLRMQNASLKRTNIESNAQIVEIKQQNDFLRMLSFFLGGGLLASSYFFVDWYRRRNEALKAEKEQAVWESLESEFKENEPIQVQHFTVDESLAPEANQSTVANKTNDDFNVNDHSHIFNSIYSSTDSDFVEEVTNVIDDAKLFLSHGRASLAIQILQNHLVEFPRESAENWLLLLEILSNEGRQEEFETAASECKKYFNVDIPHYAQTTESSGGIESSERISTELQTLWGTPEATSYLDNLIHNARNQPREGFNKELFEELVLLRDIIEEEVKLAEVIPLSNQKSTSKTKSNAKKEQTMMHRFPEIEISSDFKEMGKKLELENTKKPDSEPEMDHFEFELLDLAHR